MMSIGSGVGGVYFADNALTCDSEGNCMLKDNLIKIGGSFGGVSGSIKFADNALTCDSTGNCMLKDNLGGSIEGKASCTKGGVTVSASCKIKWNADNALTCDSEGNCMLKDELRSQGNHALDMVMSEAKKDADHRRKMMDQMMAKMKDNLGGVSVGYGKSKVGINWADNALTCDSEGNCMLKDDLIKFGASGCAFGVCANIKTADNALTCDSAGNCMLKDNLGFLKKATKSVSKGVTSAANATAKGVTSAANATAKAVTSDAGKAVTNVAGGVVLPMATSYATGGLVQASITVADNALTCDSEGNCMLKDNLLVGPSHTW